MKLTKKLFNKILFAVVVALVFAFINRCTVKAATYEDLTTDLSSDAYFTYSVSDWWTNRDYFMDLGTGTNYNPFAIGVYQNNPDGIPPNTVCLGWGFSSGLNCLDITYLGDYLNFNQPVYWGTILANGNVIALLISNDLPIISNVNGSNVTLTFDSSFIYFDRAVNYSNSPSLYYVSPESSIDTWTINAPGVQYSTTTYKSNTNWEYKPNLYVTTTTNFNFDLEPPVDYDIDFVTINSSDNSQQDYGNDLTITSEAIAIKYVPCNNEYYDYYYEFVPQGGQSTGNFEQVTDNKCIGTYNAKQNGYLMAKITDKQGNTLFGATYNVRKVGTLSTFAVNNNKFSTFLTDISSNINYGGPISGLITIPINFMSTLYNSFNGSCVPYNLGSILGHDITINCFTLQSILGSSITGIIDMICAFGIYYHLVLLIISIYRKVMNLDELDDYLPQHMYHPQHGSYDDLHS